MKRAFPRRIFETSQQPLSAGAFWVWQTVFWIYTVLWSAACWWVFYRWHGSLVARAAVAVVLIVGTPALGDLLMSYRAYQGDWARRHPRFEA